MQCFIYRSQRKKHTYLFVTERDDFSRVPQSLLKLFGPAEFSFEFDLEPNKPLAQGNSAEVLRHLTEHGFYLQLPPADEAGKRLH